MSKRKKKVWEPGDRIIILRADGTYEDVTPTESPVDETGTTVSFVRINALRDEMLAHALAEAAKFSGDIGGERPERQEADRSQGDTADPTAGQ